MSTKRARNQAVLSYIFDTNGISSRKALLLSWLSILGVGFVVMVTIGGLAQDFAAYLAWSQIIGLLVFAWLFIPAVRRCHDLGWSGAKAALWFVPLVNMWLLYNLVFKKGVWSSQAVVEKELKDNAVPRKRRGPRSRPMR